MAQYWWDWEKVAEEEAWLLPGKAWKSVVTFDGRGKADAVRGFLASVTGREGDMDCFLWS